VIDERSYKEILDEAGRKFPSSSFLRKCRVFYDANRYLSQKQVDTLDRLPVSNSNLPSIEEPKTWEELVKDLVSSRLATQEEIDQGLFDDIIEEALERYGEEENETWDTWKG